MSTLNCITLHYRSVHCHKTMYEVLERLRFEAFLDGLDEEYQVFSLIMTMQDFFTEGRLQELVDCDLFHNLILKYDVFVASSSAQSKTFAYWSMYIKLTGKCVFSSRSLNHIFNNDLFHARLSDDKKRLFSVHEVIITHYHISSQAYF